MFNVHKLQAVQFLQASKFKILRPNFYLSQFFHQALQIQSPWLAN